MITRLTKLLILVLSSVGSTSHAAQSTPFPTIELRSCDVLITADQVSKNKEGVTYSGNVKVLIGLANLRLSKVTLIKNKNGSCRLVTTK